MMSESSESFCKLLFLRRNMVSFLAFFGFFNIYSLRVNLSVAVVAMTQNYTIQTDDGIEHVQDFNWSPKERGSILGSFFYGYLLTQVVGGWLGTKIGGVRLFGNGVLVTALLNLTIPVAAHYGVGYLIAIRVMEGIFEGVTYPSIHAVWSKWAPQQERTRLAMFSFSGCYVGTLVSFPLCGFLAQHFGWSSIFYVTGVVAIIWCILWLTVVKEDPKDDPWITQKELKYIQASQAKKTSQVAYPWKSFFTSMPVWAIVCAHFCENWGGYSMLTQLPSYITDTMHVDVQTVGIISSSPYLVNFMVLPVSGILVDKIRQKNIFTNTQVRKFFTAFGFINQTIFITAATFIESPFWSILCLSLAIGVGSVAWCSFGVNHLDIAPQYASILMGISNSFATLPGFICPTLTGYIVKNKTKAEWANILLSNGVLYFFGAIFYLIFASGEKQPWAKDNNSGELDSVNITSKEAKDVENAGKKKSINLNC